VLPRKDYFSSSAVYTSVDITSSVFGEDNYDEDEGKTNDIESQVNSAVQNCSSDGIQPYPQLFLCIFFILVIIRFLTTFWLPYYP
jgi:hypothetical protein